ncbi:hypothetical protein EWM63_26255 [Pseudoduganella lutea]|uniref:Uncharacterized protein n=1 Tax=Pseudoduganella lutea TaxID=321985 RepID=A0A4P6L3P1_9BURK|nr:hypothetical protein EWM63_26255 [Pseudoduganella lutea]
MPSRSNTDWNELPRPVGDSTRRADGDATRANALPCTSQMPPSPASITIAFALAARTRSNALPPGVITYSD